MATLRQRASERPEPPLAAVVAGMRERLDRLPAGLGHQRVFSTYQRTTQAVGEAIQEGFFEDAGWVERWDVAFAELYLTALDNELASCGHVPRPWRLAFAAPADLPPLRHVLLGINAHLNYDLPQALLTVISDADFADPLQMGRRHRDHERIDGVLSSRVKAEDGELTAPGGRTLLDRLLTPLNRLGSKRFLREARQKVWHNTLELRDSRVAGPDEYAAASRSSSCSALRRSRTCSNQARSCCDWPSPALESACPHRTLLLTAFEGHRLPTEAPA